MSVTAIIRMTARPGQREALKAFSGPAVQATGQQPECHSVEFLDCVENPDAVMLIERWTSIEAHQEFIGGVIAAGGLDGLEDLLVCDMETLHYVPGS